MGQPREVELALARGVVERDAVEMRDAGDDAQRVAPGATARRGDGVGEAEGAPEELRFNVNINIFVNVYISRLGQLVFGVHFTLVNWTAEWEKEINIIIKTHHRDAFHAQHEVVRCQVARVGECVFFP